MMRHRCFRSSRLPATLALVVAALLAPAVVPAQARLPRVLAWESMVKGDENVSLRWPVAVAHRTAKEIAVADSHGPRLVFFADTGVVWAPQSTLDLQGAPVDIAGDGDRYVVSQRREPRLISIEGEAHQMRRLALPAGMVPGCLAGLPGGGVLIHDLNGGGVYSLSPRGSVSQVADSLGEDPGDLAATSGGGFLATFPAAGEVRRYDATGQETGRWTVPGDGPVPAWPVGIALEPSGAMALADRHGHRLVALDSAGRPQGIGSRKGWTQGLLHFPSRLDRLPDGRILAVDESNGRVQVFTPTVDSAGP